MKILVLILSIASFRLTFAEIYCSYFVHNPYGYTCQLTIKNPDGFNNFTEIDGRHVAGYSNEDVNFIDINSGSSLNFPSIICETFRNAKRMYSWISKINIVDENAFRHCSELEVLLLVRANLFEIHEKTFAGNSKLLALTIEDSSFTGLLPARLFEPLTELQVLTLKKFKFEELPDGIFSPLVKVTSLSLQYGSLKVVHSSWFGQLPRLHLLYLGYNQIFALDERIIDNTKPGQISFNENVCFNGTVADSVETRNYMRYKLENCIENYQNLVTGGSTTRTTSVQPSTTVTTKATTSTTTTAQTFPPGDCRPENIDTRVCEIEAKNEEILKNVSELSESNRELKIENQRLSEKFEELERQIIELTNRPCSCF